MKKLKLFLITILLSYITFFIPVCIINTYTNIEIGFSPGESAYKIILSAINQANQSIDIAAYSFTSKSITLALVDAQKKGIKIRIVADKKANSYYTAINYLAKHKILVRLNDKYIIMHNKFMIIDNKSIETGSFNYTQNAIHKNAENIIYLHNNINITKAYIKEFNRLWNESIDFNCKY